MRRACTLPLPSCPSDAMRRLAISKLTAGSARPASLPVSSMSSSRSPELYLVH